MENHLSWINKFNLVLLDEIDSTNDEARRIAMSPGSPSYLVVCAKKQTFGRGRSGKQWESPLGNLFMSVIVPINRDLEQMSQLSFVVGLALERAILGFFNKYSLRPQIELKWPNDVLLNDKKVAGILLESIDSNAKSLVIGIGVNVTQMPFVRDKIITSLYNEGLRDLDNTDVLHAFMLNFETLYDEWNIGGFLSIREMWLKKAKGLGDIITVSTGASRISGKFMDIDFKGKIRLHISSGQIHSVSTGELFFGE
ncbi:MAG: biotin--[acetyl-CoA-carboxylase] ligase [Rickettsiaceae bacterium]|nr:biotin--[acetyl-CoA-carboxylase] ligase [Rickettsiaceae bacterium]